MIVYTPAVLLAFAFACLASPIRDLPALNKPAGSEIALPSRKNQKAEKIPDIHAVSSWDPVMQHGIMCGTYSSGNNAVFDPDKFWAVGDQVSLTSPGHYKIATRGASGEGTLVSSLDLIVFSKV